MSQRMIESFARDLGRLRHEPIQKRVRAVAGEATMVDTTRALLVWEPRRVVPSYAAPLADVRGELVAAAASPAVSEPSGVRIDGLPDQMILDPSVPFRAHTADGEPLGLETPQGIRVHVAFRPADRDLADHVILDFDGFDAWYEEDERVLGHARDPLHSMDILPSSRRVRIELDGVVLADTTRARLLFEGTLLPPRAYVAREDVRVALRPSAKRTRCAYKGEASYWSAELGDGGTATDVAWTYEAPLRPAAEIGGLVAFFNERVDLSLDGEPLPRPLTPWS
jgi:uncharacterized protein (DUF427 family)